MSEPRTHTHGFTRIVHRRLLKPVWNSLVAYGWMWLPADQYRLQFPPFDETPTADGTVPAAQREPTAVASGRSQPERKPLRAS
ncbi:hypothetical protein [Streptomyces sp. NPDC006879]|uniref:hypothetical protein n=1 Tax=Streptomyces sp. NPDC006879 TaxID=3364767 RepID=UPI0036943E37